MVLNLKGGIQVKSKIKSKSKRLARVDQEWCVACGACMKECRFNAITIKAGVYAQVHGDQCVGCGKCAKICPASVIEIIPREETHYA